MIMMIRLRNILIFIFLYFFVDLLMTQLFLFNFYYNKLEKQFASDIENRILNPNYQYTFAKKKSFKSNYIGQEYTIKTNNLGFRDYEVRDIDKDYNYTIVIGDSFVEGVGLEYEETVVGHLNKKIRSYNIKNYEFLNAGVTAYSSYIYLKKIVTIIKENPWLKTDSVIVVLDKSDIPDAQSYLDRPKSFPDKKVEHKFKSTQFFLKDLKKGDLWRFLYKQTTTGFVLKKIGDILDLKRRNLRDRYLLSKRLEKSFFKINIKQINALRSTNVRKGITNFLHGDLWETKTKKYLDFEIENVVLLKNFLDKKNIELLVVIFPWPFELVNETPRENYKNYVIQKLMNKKINYISAYKYFLDGDIYTNISDHYIYNDQHLNGQGNSLLSDVIWKNYLINEVERTVSYRPNYEN